MPAVQASHTLNPSKPFSQFRQAILSIQASYTLPKDIVKSPKQALEISSSISQLYSSLSLPLLPTVKLLQQAKPHLPSNQSTLLIANQSTRLQQAYPLPATSQSTHPQQAYPLPTTIPQNTPKTLRKTSKSSKKSPISYPLTYF